MNTASNSRPFAACTVMSWIASCPACAWLSPASSDACVRKAANGDMISPVSASGVLINEAMPLVASGAGVPAMAATPSPDNTFVNSASAANGSGVPNSSTGSATASLPKPSCVTKASAALTSSSRFSSRSGPSLSVR